MGATVEFPDGTRARVEQGEWLADDPRARQLLEDQSRAFEPEFYVPDWDVALATYIAERLGGRIVEQDPPPEPPHDDLVA